MPVLASKLSPRSEDFKANASAMQVAIDDLNATLAKLALGGGDGPRAKHVTRQIAAA
jgi:3-methylcrotonyl-CoA carboxylase beta subunit